MKILTHEQLMKIAAQDDLVAAIVKAREADIDLMMHEYHRLLAGAGLDPRGFKIEVRSPKK